MKMKGGKLLGDSFFVGQSVAIFFAFVLLGMTDYQVLPPGLNATTHNGLPVDPNDFQIKR